MNRREFFSLAAAAAATSAMPSIADARSGLIQGKRFVLTSPITLEVSGPVVIEHCEFVANFPADSILRFARRGDPSTGVHAVTIISDYGDEPIEIRNCSFGAAGMVTLGDTVTRTQAHLLAAAEALERP